MKPELEEAYQLGQQQAYADLAERCLYQLNPQQRAALELHKVRLALVNAAEYIKIHGAITMSTLELAVALRTYCYSESTKVEE